MYLNLFFLSFFFFLLACLFDFFDGDEEEEEEAEEEEAEVKRTLSAQAFDSSGDCVEGISDFALQRSPSGFVLFSFLRLFHIAWLTYSGRNEKEEGKKKLDTHSLTHTHTHTLRHTRDSLNTSIKINKVDGGRTRTASQHGRNQSLISILIFSSGGWKGGWFFDSCDSSTIHQQILGGKESGIRIDSFRGTFDIGAGSKESSKSWQEFP